MNQLKGKREAYFDNARFILIVFVVFGHVIQPIFEESAMLLSLYTTIYLFHMAGFILISGYFAKGFRRPGYLFKIAKKTLPTFIVFQIVYTIVQVTAKSSMGKETTVDLQFLLSPRFTLWFLLSLFSWNLLLFLFARFRWWTILIAFAVGITIGFININTFLSITRTFVFFPFFLLGFYLQPGFFQRLRRTSWRILGACLLGVFFIVFYFYTPENHSDWLLGAYSYTYMGVGNLAGSLIRLIQYILMVLAIFSTLSLIPNKQFHFTKLGTRTLYIYLLHGIVIQAIRNFVPENVYMGLSNHLILIVLFTLIIVYVLGSSWVQKITRPVIEVNFNSK